MDLVVSYWRVPRNDGDDTLILKIGVLQNMAGKFTASLEEKETSWRSQGSLQQSGDIAVFRIENRGKDSKIVESAMKEGRHLSVHVAACGHAQYGPMKGIEMITAVPHIGPGTMPPHNIPFGFEHDQCAANWKDPYTKAEGEFAQRGEFSARDEAGAKDAAEKQAIDLVGLTELISPLAAHPASSLG
jgi:hypothetical protein